MQNIEKLAKELVDKAGINKGSKVPTISEILTTYYNTLANMKESYSLTKEEVEELINSAYGIIKSKIDMGYLLKRIDKDERKKRIISN